MIGVVRDLDQNVRQAFRAFQRSPGTLVVAIISAAFALGTNAAVFTLVDAALLRDLPGVASPSELVSVYAYELRSAQYRSLSWRDYETLGESGAFAETAAFLRYPLTLGRGRRAERLVAELVTSDYFDVLGTRPLLGRMLSREDDGGAPAAILSAAFFRRHFFADPEALGRELRLNGVSVTVVGVAPEGFGGTLVDWHRRPDVWLALSSTRELLGGGWREPGSAMLSSAPMYMMAARLRADITLPEARAIAASFASASSATAAGDGEARVTFELIESTRARFWPGYRDRVERLAAVMIAAAALALFAAAVNLGGVFVSRLEARRRDVAVRLALGADRLVVARFVAVESALVLVPGAVCGLGMAFLLPGVLARFPNALGISLDVDYSPGPRTMAVATGLVLVIVALAAVHLSRIATMNVASGLKADREHGSFRTFRSSSGIGVSLQLGATVVLLVGALFAVKSTWKLSTVETGLRLDRVVGASVDLNAPELTDDDRQRLFGEILSAFRGMGGVRSAGVGQPLPARGMRSTKRIRLGGSSLPAFYSIVSPGWFDTVGLSVLQGRDFETSHSGALEIAVNRALADRLWPSSDALGRTLILEGETEARRVIAVVSNARMVDVWESAAPHLFLPLAQGGPREAWILVRSDVPMSDVANAIERHVAGLELPIPFSRAEPVSDLVRDRASSHHVVAILTAGLSLGTAIVALLGLYALASSRLNGRRRELAIRAAVGASTSQLVAAVHRDAWPSIVAGLVMGLVGALLLASRVTSVLFGVSPADPAVLATALGLVAIVSVSATHIVARRAAGIDPRASLS